MDDLLREFLTETNESLDVVDVELVRFEQDPNNAKILDNIFRLVHTIKGTCGFLGLPRLEALAHAAETLMGKFRDGMPVTGEAVTLDSVHHRPDQGDARASSSSNEQEPEGVRPRPDRRARAHGDRRHGSGGSSRRRPRKPPAAAPAPHGERDRRHADRADARAPAAPGRGVARRARARLPRDARPATVPPEDAVGARRRAPPRPRAAQKAAAAADEGRSRQGRQQDRQPVDPRQRRDARDT